MGGRELERLRNVFRILMALGIVGLFCLTAFEAVIQYALLDAVLPQRLLEQATSEELMEISARLGKGINFGPLPWVWCGLVCAVSTHGFWSLRKLG